MENMTPLPTETELLYQIVRRILRNKEQNFSRNRNFEAYNDALVQRAWRIARHLKNLERDLLSLIKTETLTSALTLSRDEHGHHHLHLDFGDHRGKRQSTLIPQEWAMLLEHPKLARSLG